jgi:uncharacterized protein YigE (DUF2233 family)
MIRVLALLGMFFAAGSVQAACQNIDYDNKGYVICEARAGDDLRLWHSDDQGRLLGSFGGVQDVLGEGEDLIFAMNAGMYHQDRRPVGLYIENGVETARLQDGGGYGNFGLTPNGVFCIADGWVRVIETNEFRNTTPACQFASQSGPMLVIDGKLHPKFLPESTSLNYRNGVGTSTDGQTVIFAISEQPVNFFDFAMLFLDHLQMPDALFFDGKVSRLFARDLNRHDAGFPLGPIVGLVGRAGN